jgi:hypothetical protein
MRDTELYTVAAPSLYILSLWSGLTDDEGAARGAALHPLSIYLSLWSGLTDDEGAARGTAFFADMAGVREFEENFEKYGPLMFGLHDGQSEAPKIMAKRVSSTKLSKKARS